LPQLLSALTNHNFYVRDNIAANLANAIYAGKITSDDAAPALPVAIQNLTYEDTNIVFLVNTRFRAVGLISALAREPDLSVPALAAVLADPHPTVAAEGAQALGRFGPAGKVAVPALTNAIFSTNTELSCAAVVSLSQIAPEAFTGETLAQALLLTIYPGGSFRMRLAQSLGRLGPRGESVVPVLLSLLAAPNDIDRMMAAQSLGLIGRKPATVIPALMQGLQDPNLMVRLASVDALGKFGASARDAVSPLIAIAQAHPELKGNVRIALDQIDPKARVP
jgi:HEAT repeat protein